MQIIRNTKTKKNTGTYNIRKSNDDPHLLNDQTLQKFIGNMEVQRMFQAHEILAKLLINQPGDKLERDILKKFM